MRGDFYVSEGNVVVSGAGPGEVTVQVNYEWIIFELLERCENVGCDIIQALLDLDEEQKWDEERKNTPKTT